MFRAVVILSLLFPASAAYAGHAHGAREYRETGYYQWDAYKCKWVWCPYASRTYGSYDNHSTTLHLTVNNFQSSAKRGEQQYATVDLGYKAGNPLDPNVTINMAKELLGVAYRGANDGFRQAMTYASQQGANDIEVVQELVQVKKLEASALILESSKPELVHRYESPVHPKSDPALVAEVAGVPTAIEKKCKGCHDDGQKGGGVILKPFVTMNFEQADLAMEYVTRLDDDNCAKRAELSRAEHKQLINYLCQVKAKSNQ